MWVVAFLLTLIFLIVTLSMLSSRRRPLISFFPNKPNKYK